MDDRDNKYDRTKRQDNNYNDGDNDENQENKLTPVRPRNMYTPVHLSKSTYLASYNHLPPLPADITK